MREKLNTTPTASKSSSGRRARTERISALVAIAASATFLLAACSSGGAAKPAAVSTEIMDEIPTVAECPEPATATIWALQNSDAQIAVDKAMADAFAEQCEGTKIEYQYFPGEALNSKVTTIMVSGTPPTAIQPTDPVLMKPYFESGQLLNASEVLSKVNPDWEDAFVPSALQRTRLFAADGDESVHGFPAWGAAPIILWYNKDVFKKAGIDNPPETLEELNDDIEIFKDADIIPIALGNADKAPGTFWAQYLTEREAGTDPFEAALAGEPDAWSDEGIVEGLTQAQKMAEDGAFGVGFDSTGNQNGADRALFFTGRAAMMLSNVSFLSKVASAAPEFVDSGAVGYTTVPSGDWSEDTVVGNSSVNYLITANSTEAEQKLIATYFTTMLSSAAYAKAEAAIGVVPAVAGVETLIPDTIPGKVVGWAYDLASNNDLGRVWTSSYGSYSTVLQENVAAVLNGSMTVKQFSDAMNETIE